MTEDYWIGQEINGYVINQLLGAGPSGKTYKATKLSTGNTVALKILLPELGGSDPKIRERFNREAEALIKLGKHPNIIQLRDKGEFRDIPYIVTDYKSGGSLRELLDKNKDGLDPDTTVDIFSAIASALDYLHEQGVIHRDLKPENILLEMSQDGTYHPFISDFGISILREGTKTSQTGSIVGTYNYMAPEAFDQKAKKTKQIDIYSFGTMLYEALEGKTPYNGNLTELVRLHLSGKFPYPNRIVQKTNKYVVNVFRKALATRPQKRQQTATDVIKELRNAIQQGTYENQSLKYSKQSVFFGFLAVLVAIICGLCTIAYNAISPFPIFVKPNITTSPTLTQTIIPKKSSTPSFTATSTQSPTPTFTITSRPTNTSRPTPLGLGGSIENGPVSLILEDYQLRPEGHPEPAAIVFSLKFMNTGQKQVEINYDLSNMSGVGNDGTTYIEFYTGFRNYDQQSCIRLAGQIDYSFMKKTFTLNSSGATQEDFYLNPVGTTGCDVQDHKARVPFGTEWVDLEWVISYHVIGETGTQTVRLNWRLIR